MFLQYSNLLISLKEGQQAELHSIHCSSSLIAANVENGDFPLTAQFTTRPKDTVSMNLYWLVVLTILKNMKVNGKDSPIYYGKSKMFETTNQYIFISMSSRAPRGPIDQAAVGQQKKQTGCIVLTSYPQSSLSFPHSFT